MIDYVERNPWVLIIVAGIFGTNLTLWFWAIVWTIILCYAHTARETYRRNRVLDARAEEMETL